jgi:hypothetical protein
MTTAVPHDAPTVPLPLEQYARAFDDLFHTHIQRQRFREYLAGLLLPRDRNKTLTALVGAEPITQAQTAPVQQLQFFLSESEWDAEAVTTRQIEVLQATPLTAPHAEGALVIDETGDRKDGTHTAHVGYQYLGSIGKLGHGLVAVSSLWADEQVYYPLQVRPYTPAARLAGGKQHPAFRTKPQLALELVTAARAADIPFRAVVADSLYGEHPEFKRVMWQADIPYVLAIKPSQVVWTPPPEPESPWEAAVGGAQRRRPSWGVDGGGAPLPRRTRGDLVGRRSAAGELRPPVSHPLGRRDRRSAHPAGREHLVPRDQSAVAWDGAGHRTPRAACGGTRRGGAALRLTPVGRARVQPGQAGTGLGRLQVRSDRAIRRHWALVCCAFAFCWWHESQRLHGGDVARPASPLAPPLPLPPQPGVGGKWGTARDLTRRTRQLLPTALLATSAATRAELA